MTHSLEDLKSGKLIGLKRLKLACGLTEFPTEIFALADTLEILDLTDNQFTEIPNRIAELKHLRVLFLSNNRFTEFPKILASCPALTMIGFKSNQIETVPENAFPPLLRWLILTDNKIKKIPKSLGDCNLLQKCALAGNQIEVLPLEMAKCVNLELLRISANKLKVIPTWLFELPKLSWVAFGGNPGVPQVKITEDFESYSWEDFEVKELLGEGASGLISKATWKSKKEEVAIKVFKGAVTSDGLPEDEMGIAIAAGFHENLVEVLGKTKNHLAGKSGLIMKLITPDYINLGNPPSLQTCTRDVFDEAQVFNAAGVLKIAKSIASVCAQLHQKGINHGDLYAHNIMINKNADCLLGDFGAATFYDVNSESASNIERVEVSAFGCLLEDILGLIPENDIDEKLRKPIQKIINDCTKTEVKLRPSFSEILERLN